MKYDVTRKPTRGAQRTLDAFSGSLLTLLAEQPFEQVTVNELCQRAGYPRATFYNYFDDKYDLLDYGWMRIGAHLQLDEASSMSAEEGLRVCFDRAYDLCAAHLDVVKRTLAYNAGSGYLLNRLRGVMQTQIRTMLRACPERVAGRIPYELIADHFGNTLFLVLEWSLLGERRCTKAQAYEYLRYLLAGV
ncbi:TetR/AcrR family transcriptional regulator [Eggerthella timonensis]|uniref:TetR/AcrR family transcriptional regulator n=1 Tax=Eggerthella timonensis TaxID=1871008 RepID=UPI000C77B136|nr:TetR/AcrR family transcriptional regulator [Eggerthella timonensis]